MWTELNIVLRRFNLHVNNVINRLTIFIQTLEKLGSLQVHSPCLPRMAFTRTQVVKLLNAPRIHTVLLHYIALLLVLVAGGRQLGFGPALLKHPLCIVQSPPLYSEYPPWLLQFITKLEMISPTHVLLECTLMLVMENANWLKNRSNGAQKQQPLQTAHQVTIHYKVNPTVALFPLASNTRIMWWAHVTLVNSQLALKIHVLLAHQVLSQKRPRRNAKNALLDTNVKVIHL